MATRSKRLFGPTVVGTTQLVLYTTPAGETALLKHLSVANITGASVNLRLRLNGTTQNENIHDDNVASTAAEQYTPWFMVLNPGDVLRGVASAASLIVTGFGAELEGAAD